MRCTLLWPVFLIAACESDAAAPKEKPPEVASAKLAGVWPDRFDCASITTTDVLEQLLGGATRKVESANTPAKGTPRACEYDVASSPPEHWTYDFDCRDGYKQRADALFEQYRTMNADRIAQFDKVTDAGTAKMTNDAGQPIEYTKPGNATEVAVGAKALDHNDQAILFIDDDAPCYVRVIGPDATKRLELAKLVAKNLTFANAPMTPRSLK